MRSDPRLLAAASLVLLAGCTTGEGIAGLGADPNWGEANRQTLAAQVIDPAPHYDTATPSTNGQAAVGAIERYRTDKVKQPDKQMTSRTGGSAN